MTKNCDLQVAYIFALKRHGVTLEQINKYRQLTYVCLLEDYSNDLTD